MPHRITPIDRRDRALEAAAPIIAFKQGALLTELMFPRISQALRYIIRNTTLPPRVRAEAQLQLTQMHSYTRGTQIRNRCIMGGQGRGVLRDFKMTRVRGLLDKTNLLGNKTANPVVVPIPYGGHGRKHSWYQESKLVMRGGSFDLWI
jgi:ribosomal protein S14